MTYTFRVSALAAEFGVHRNTIRNWIRNGSLPARPGPGRQYVMEWEAYRALCERYGRSPRPGTDRVKDPAMLQQMAGKADLPPVFLGRRSPTFTESPAWIESCLACGSCAAACPISGVDGLDPCRIIRMALLDLEEELLATDWPWKCTLCGRCEESCPMAVGIVGFMRHIRSLRDRERVPGPIHSGVTTCLERGNNLGIPEQDFLALLDDLGRELALSCPGFTVPVDRYGARLLVTINSKEPFTEPDSMKWWWRIFHEAGESWTIASSNWEGVNWGFFSGDDEAMRTIVGRMVDNLQRLNCSALLLPE